MKIGVQLRKYRVKSGYSQQYVADCLGISRNAYIAWENDKTSINLNRLASILNLYQIDASEFLSTDKD